MFASKKMGYKMTCYDTMSIFPKIKDMNPSDAQATQEALPRYCELDTWAMVKVLERLKRVVG